LRPSAQEKTKRIRPLKPGTSIGHVNITAGTLGFPLYKDDEVYIASNAHVFVDNPFLPPKKIIERRIVQPGRYDGGDPARDVVAEYVWHQKIWDVWEWGEKCPITRTIDRLYKLLGRTSRVLGVEENHIDFAVAKALVDVEEKTFSGLPEENMFFVGLIFAGSSYGHGVFCKVIKYWPSVLSGFTIPWTFEKDVVAGDKVVKDGRTTCYNESAVWITSANVVVSYGAEGVAWFRDVALTEEGFVEPGDSGSPVFVVG